jgi:SAM-dependent methyltransferase
MAENDLRRGAVDASIWDGGAADRYVAAKHGPDGKVFLDPYLYSLLSFEQLAGKNFLDLGCGAGPWSEHALSQGAKSVTAVDLNEAMLEKARQRLSGRDGLPENVRVISGDVANLVLRNESADQLASINVGCNLPNVTFQNHFKEAMRVARTGGRMVVTAPNSLLVPFTNANESTDIQAEIDWRWRTEQVRDSSVVKRVIDSLRDVLRATFIVDEDGKPVLITEENAQLVKEGTPIVRRIPGLAVDNNFHTAESYIQAAVRAGWTINSFHQASFKSEQERQVHNEYSTKGEDLGSQYVANPPFLVMDLEKRD